MILPRRERQTIRFAAWLTAIALCAPMTERVALARDADDKQPVADVKTGETTLADRQAVIGDRIKRLEDRMFQLAQALKKTDPKKAARLVEGLSALREDGLKQDVTAVVRLLRENQLADAADAQVTIEDQMQLILKLLMEETNDLEKQREELKRLEEIRKDLNKLLNQQMQTKAKSERLAAQKKLAESLEDAAQTARDLLNRQEGLNASQGQGGANAARPADAQAALRGETEALSRDVADLAEKLRAASEGTPPSGESPEGETPSGEPGKGESSEEGSSSSEQSSQGGEGKKGASSEAAKKAEDAESHLNDAADAMQDAERALRAADEASAEGDQSKAEDELRKAVENLQEEARELRNRLKLEEIAEEQRKLTEESSDLLDDMSGKEKGGDKSGDGDKQGKENESKEGGSKEGQSGDSQQGGSQQQSGGSNQQQQGGPQQPPASPGQRPLEEAIPHQQEATKKLEEDLPTDAVEEQQRAIEKLEQAKEDLEERLDQLRREQQEQLLAALESRFRAMLSRQLEVNKATDRLVELGVDNWKRSDQLELAELSEKQRWVGDEADEAMFLLTEEGSTVVLPPLLEEVRDDSRDVADRLASAQADREVLALQAELEAVLRDMIDSVKEQQESLEQNGGGGGGGGGSGSPPLLPGSAELKLLRALQLRINSATTSLHDELGESVEADREIDSALGRLAEKQQRVADMAKSMHESLQKAQ